MAFIFRRASGCALALFLSAFSAVAGADDYRFELVSTDYRVGSGAVIELLLTDLRTGEPVADAVIYATRMDMAPDGMATMTSPVTAMPAEGPGRYRFVTDLTMAGGVAVLGRCEDSGRTGNVVGGTRVEGDTMSGPVRLLMMALVAGGAAWGGLTAGEQGVTVASLREAAVTQFTALTGREAATMPATEASGPVIYWRHPDGLPEWSATERQTSDGRDFLPVLASEDLSLSPEAMTAAPESGERRILYYRNPMGLADTSPVPKQDSMGMDYIPVYDGEDSDDGSVTVSPGKLQRTGVRTTVAVLAPLAASLHAPGIVVLDERRISVISLRADAFIETVADVTTGSTIAEGAPLVTLYSPEIAAALAQFVTDVRSEGQQRAGARQRLENLGVPGEVIDRIAAEGLVSVSIPIMAPRSGVVLERMAVEGMMSEAGETLFRIADTSMVWVIAEVPESALMDIAAGAEVRVSFRGLAGDPMTGRIDTIYPEVDMMTRTGKLRIELPNPDGRLRANMFAEVEIMLGGAPVVQVPEGAVIDTGDRQVVILDLGEGRFRPEPVMVGRRGGGMIEIVSGIEAGDTVVSAATFLIDAESNLNAALAALAAPEADQ
jgi:Cu(I)/Ag(I) efflux system membrane fusion protein